MLNGKMVLTEDYFGTVLKETERSLTIRSIRRKEPNPDCDDPIRSYFCAPDPTFRWCAEDCERTMTREQAGVIKVCETVPSFLEEERLGYQPQLFLTTEVNGRMYIDW